MDRVPLLDQPVVQGVIMGESARSNAEERRQGIKDVDLYALLRMLRMVVSESQRVDMNSTSGRFTYEGIGRLSRTVCMVEEEAYASSRGLHTNIATAAEYYSFQTQQPEALRVIRDMRREMSDMQAELLALREQRGSSKTPDQRLSGSRSPGGFWGRRQQIMAPTTQRDKITPVNDTNPNNMTPESVQAMIDQALLRNSTNGDGSHSSHGDNRRNVQTARPCFYADFMKCQPLNFKGAEGVFGLTRWIEKMESVEMVKKKTLGPEAYAMTWEVLKRKMTDKYCPQGEIKKLEIELWNLKVKGNDVPAYTERFQELTLICTKFVANETEKVDKYLSGLPDNIYGNVKAAKPKTLDELN
ncbi:putative reverse transcriptase domain-containing protein [Tanacetum coccineum]